MCKCQAIVSFSKVSHLYKSSTLILVNILLNEFKDIVQKGSNSSIVCWAWFFLHRRCGARWVRSSRKSIRLWKVKRWLWYSLYVMGHWIIPVIRVSPQGRGWDTWWGCFIRTFFFLNWGCGSGSHCQIWGKLRDTHLWQGVGWALTLSSWYRRGCWCNRHFTTLGSIVFYQVLIMIDWLRTMWPVRMWVRWGRMLRRWRNILCDALMSRLNWLMMWTLLHLLWNIIFEKIRGK